MAGGPYAFVLESLAADLEKRGYSCRTIENYLSRVRHVTHCLETGSLRRSDLTAEGLRSFARSHPQSCKCPYGLRGHSRRPKYWIGLRHVLPPLRTAGIAPPPAPEPFSAELDRYESFLREAKGLSDPTVDCRRRILVLALQRIMGRKRFRPDRLTRASVQAYLNEVAKAQSPYGVRRQLVAIRDFLRFLQVNGENTGEIISQLMGPPAHLPLMSNKALTVPQLRKLLACVKGGPFTRLRNRAIVLLLARTGLRRVEVARLLLGDFDGRHSVLTIRKSKSKNSYALPVPQDARDAILAYVRNERQEVKASALFASASPPYDRGISLPAISGVVADAFRRSGIRTPSRGCHVLRHTLATQLVREDRPLKAVADVLRHKDIDTTNRYVRIDLERLRQSAAPWPRGREKKKRAVMELGTRGRR